MNIATSKVLDNKMKITIVAVLSDVISSANTSLGLSFILTLSRSPSNSDFE